MAKSSARETEVAAPAETESADQWPQGSLASAKALFVTSAPGFGAELDPGQIPTFIAKPEPVALEGDEAVLLGTLDGANVRVRLYPDGHVELDDVEATDSQAVAVGLGLMDAQVELREHTPLHLELYKQALAKLLEVLEIRITWNENPNNAEPNVRRFLTDRELLRLPIDFSLVGSLNTKQHLARLFRVPIVRDNLNEFLCDVLLSTSYIWLDLRAVPFFELGRQGADVVLVRELLQYSIHRGLYGRAVDEALEQFAHGEKAFLEDRRDRS